MRPAYWLALATIVLGPGMAVVGFWLVFPPFAVLMAIIQIAFLAFVVTSVRRILLSPTPASQAPRDPAGAEARYGKMRAELVLMPLAMVVLFALALIYIEDQTPVLLIFGGGAISVIGGVPSQRLILGEMRREAQADS